MSVRKVIKHSWGVLFFISVLFNSCGNRDNAPQESREKGLIHISVDESFRPVIDSQISVFENQHPEAKIIAHYKPEADCLRDFAVDSIRLIITTRKYSNKEEQFISDSLGVDPSQMIIAYDAVAMIVHPSSKDTLMTMAEVKDLLTGSGNTKKAGSKFPVFDGTRATSTVRFIMDSILRGQPLGTNAVAAESSEKVIDYVSRTPNAVGFIGVSWIGNPEDETQLSYLDKVKVVQLEHPAIPGKYVTPAQFNIYYGRYPMIRQLVFVLKEKVNGVAHNFANFLTAEKGQLIFKRAYLMPAQLSFGIRDAHLTQ
jgi:phosphate transport system substrate-binding protein